MSILDSIETPRLRLFCLDADYLSAFLFEPDVLENQLGFPVSRDVVTVNARRAIQRKLERMMGNHMLDAAWISYWLIVTRHPEFGAGLIGFKGKSNADGEVEVGYGLDPSVQGKGIMTEALGAFISWAFECPDVQAITATRVLIDNVRSQRVLEKCGMIIVNSTKDGISYRLERVNWKSRKE